jgi:hypothetical protein
MEQKSKLMAHAPPRLTLRRSSPAGARVRRNRGCASWLLPPSRTRAPQNSPIIPISVFSS